MKVDLRREMWGDLVNFKTYTNCLSVPEKLGMSHITISCYKKDFISHFVIIGSYNPWCAGQGVGSILEVSKAECLLCVWPQTIPSFLGTQEHHMSQLLMVNGAKTEFWSTNYVKKWYTHLLRLGPQPPVWSSVLSFVLYLPLG